MAQTFPAMRGKIGTTEYFLVSLKAGFVAKNVTMPKDIPGWENINWADRWQRKPNLGRIRNKIAPYFAKDKDRFSGALIVAMQNAKKVKYEPVKEIFSSKGVTGGHESAADSLGFLTLPGGEVLIPIDGQHRVLALKWAIDGKTDNKDLAFRSNPDLANDDIATILIKFDEEPDRKKARKIFNKVNQYAQSTNANENYITNDDDPVAVLTRRMTEGREAIIENRLVEESGSRLSEKSHCFSTLATLAKINKQILFEKGQKEYFTKKAGEEIEKDQENALFDILKDSWLKLLDNVNIFKECTADPDKSGDERRRELGRENLLARPIGQTVLVHAYLKLTEMRQENVRETIPGREGEAVVPRTVGMPEPTAFERLNKIDWRISNPQWQDVLTRKGNRVLTGPTAIKIGTDFVTYLAGGLPDQVKQQELINKIVGSKDDSDDSDYKLPPPVV